MLLLFFLLFKSWLDRFDILVWGCIHKSSKIYIIVNRNESCQSKFVESLKKLIKSLSWTSNFNSTLTHRFVFFMCWSFFFVSIWMKPVYYLRRGFWSQGSLLVLQPKLYGILLWEWSSGGWLTERLKRATVSWYSWWYDDYLQTN